MLRIISYALVGVTASFITSVYQGAGIVETLIVGVLAGTAAIVVWMIGSFAADWHWRPLLDAATMSEGVCPSCRTFNSLEEVTSADPNHRYVDCLACKEQYRVSHKHDALVAERLGKKDD